MSFRSKSRALAQKQTLKLWLPSLEDDIAVVKRSPPVDNSDRLKYQESLWEFFLKAWEILEPATPLDTNWHIELIIEYLELVDEGKILKLLINIAPRHLKSIIVSVVYPCWQWLRRPYLRSIYLSYSSGLANDLSDLRRKLIQSEWYQSIAPEISLSNTKNRISEFENNFTGTQIARGLEGTVTGAGGTSQIWDDPNDPEKVESDKVRDRTLKNYKDFSIGRRNDPKNTAIIVIQQRTHEKDISGYIKTEQPDFVTLVLPTVAEEDETIVFPKSGKVVERKAGDLLHPSRFGEEQVEEAKRTLGSYMFAGRHQQRPIPREGGILKEQYWQYYLAPPPCHFKIWSWDTAFKKGKQNDFSAGILMGVFGNNFYVLDVFCDRLEFPELKRLIVALQTRDRAQAVLIENAASGQSLIQELKRETTLPVIPQKVDRDKVARVNAIAPLIEAGRVHLPHTAPWLADFLIETAGFPNSAHDDRCFVAGTKVSTIFGDRNIEDLKEGDLVLTPYGVRKVKASRMTGKSKVITKFGLTGTPDHPIYTENKGFVKMEALTHAFELSKYSLWKILHWSVLNQSYLTELFTGEWEGKEDTIYRNRPYGRAWNKLRKPQHFRPQKIKKEKRQKDCTLPYTNITAVKQFPRVIMSTTKMAIRIIIALLTWSVYRLANIIKSLKTSIAIGKINILRKFDRWHRHGMALKKELNGIKPTEEKCGKSWNTSNISASNAKRNLNLGIHEGLNSVPVAAPTNIIRKEENTTAKQFVEPVKKNLFPLKTLAEITQKPVLLNVENLLQEEEVEKSELLCDVYNLAVEGGVYYANGLLVHNCDALSQGINYLATKATDTGAIATTGKKRKSAGTNY